MMERGVFTELEIRKEYGYVRPHQNSAKSKIGQYLRCHNGFIQKFFCGLFPILSWLPKYSLKDDLPGDLIGGITTAIVRIPQSLAYGILAGVEPVNGMYTAFFAPLTYGFLGTSKHVSVGTFAIVSLMLGAALEKYELSHPFNHIISNSTTMSTSAESPLAADEMVYKLSIITSITFLIGIMQIGMGGLQLGFVALFLSDPLVSGFTTAAAFHVFTTQIKACFGVSFERQTAPFAIIKTYIQLFGHLYETNLATLIISCVCVALLYPVKVINVKYKKKLRNIPIPIELFVVVLGTALSAGFNFAANYDVQVVGPIQSGFRAPVAPKPEMWPSLISDAFSIAVVSFSMTVSLGKLFGTKHGYTISPNHELFALGVAQLSCATFRGHACAGALARSSVKESSGTRTQLSDFVSCSVILVVLFLLGPYLAALPSACLSCIIIVNLRSLFLQFQQLPGLLDLCKYDFVTWVVTFSATLLLGVDIGLLLGVVSLLIVVVLRVYHPHVTIRGRLGNTHLYRDVDKFQEASEISGVRIVRFPQSPFFANKESFRSLATTLVQQQRRAKIHCSCAPCSDAAETKIGDEKVKLVADIDEVRYRRDDETATLVTSSSCRRCCNRRLFAVVFDCSGWNFIDTVGMESVKQVCDRLNATDLRVCLASLQPQIFDKLVKVGVLTTDGQRSTSANAYPTVHTAVQALVPPEITRRRSDPVVRL